MTKTAFLFPGQGAQIVGMGKESTQTAPAAKSLFDRASAILGYDLLAICLEGPADRLNATDVSQPALFVAGLAAVERLRIESPGVIATCQAAAGLSLGEYTALVFADAIAFEDGVRLVQVRGESMQAAADATPSGMVSVLGLELEMLEALCRQASVKGRIRVANHLCPGNLVVSGDMAACEEIDRLASAAGAMKTIRLAVAGAFHTEIMEPATTKLVAALAAVEIKPPRIPVISNVDAQAHADPDEIRGLLILQVVEPVLWEASIRRLLADGFDHFYELGPGRVLAGLMKRIQRKIEVTNVAA